jgi:hypothetical protein
VDQTELLDFLLNVVEARHLSYAIAGSHASMAFGEARFTNDIDVVVGLAPATLRQFCGAFPFPEFYVSEDGARAAAAKGGMFNIIHPESGLKIDVIVPKTEHDWAQLQRVVRAPTIGSRVAAFVSPEDVILKKMEAFEEGKSEKHLRDIAGILKTMGGRIDRQYIDEWAPRLNVGHVWTEVVRRFPGSESRPER